jgi:hypothetical protein
MLNLHTLREKMPLLHLEKFSRILFLQSTVCTVIFLVGNGVSKLILNASNKLGINSEKKFFFVFQNHIIYWKFMVLKW